MKNTVKTSDSKPDSHSPLESMEEWDDFLKERYPEPGAADGKTFQAVDPTKTKEQFRDYEKNARPSVREFYRQNHLHQSYEFAQAKRKEYLGLNHRKMGIWEAMEYLNTLVDDSDPDTDLSQLEHLLQTSEHIRADGLPRWFILAGMVHDLGKMLCLWGEPQWAVVGDTFPTGCAYSDKIVYPEYFVNNPDHNHPVYSTKYGVYEPNCGLDKVQLSWGHDEYVYHMMKDYLPEPAL